MEKETFPNKEVGNFFNENFICYKYEGTKGIPERIKKHGFRGFPTLYFFSPDETLKHKYVGGIFTKNFIPLGKTALNDNNNLYGMDKRFKNGERGFDLLYNYVMTLSRAGNHKSDNVIEAFFKNLDKSKLLKLTNEIRFGWTIRKIDHPGFEYIYNNYKFLVDNKKEFWASDILDNCIDSYIKGYKNQNDYKIFYNRISKYKYRNTDRMLTKLKMSDLWIRKKYDEYFKTRIEAIKTLYGGGWNEYYRLSQDIFKQFPQPKYLKMARDLAKIAMDKKPNNVTYLNYAQALFQYDKKKNKSEIIKYIEMAIAYIKENFPQKEYKKEQKLLEMAKKI